MQTRTHSKIDKNEGYIKVNFILQSFLFGSRNLVVTVSRDRADNTYNVFIYNPSVGTLRCIHMRIVRADLIDSFYVIDFVS